MNFIIQIIVGVVLSLASSLLQQAFAKPQDKTGGTRGSVMIGGKVPQYFLIGTVAEAGKLEYRNSWGDVDGVPNAYVTDVRSFGDLPITGMIGRFVNGVRRDNPSAGAVAQGFPIEIDGDEGVPHFWEKFFEGTQTDADTYLIDKFGGDEDREWASDMIGVGVPYLITTALWSDTVWTGFPEVVGEFQGIKLYDPRKDSTKGGSGPQRWAGAIPTPEEQATWAFSDNNMVMIYNIERGIYYNGAHVWGGKKSASELPYDAWAAAMDACDLAINLKDGGTEKQFRAGRLIALNERPADVIREFLVGCNGRIAHLADGTVFPLVGVPNTADGAFSDADVLATNSLGTIPFPNLDEVINGATATYREPEQSWEDKETAPYIRSDLVTEDDGRENIEGLSLDTTFSGTQAQRILKAVVEEGRRFRRHVVALPPEFAQFRPLQVLAWSSERFGYSAKFFLITARTVEPFGNVVLGLHEIDPSDHDWDPDTDQKPLTFTPIRPNRPDPQEVSGPSVAPVPGELAYDAFWSSASVQVDVSFVRVSHRMLGASGDPDYTTLVPKPGLLTGSARIGVPFSLRGETIEVQLEYVTPSGRPVVASAWMPVTIADVQIGPDDLTDELNRLRQENSRTIEQMQADRSRAIALLANGLLDRVMDQQTIRTEVTARFGTTEAKFEQQINVVAGDLGALSEFTQALSTTFAQTSASFQSQITTVSSGIGSLSSRMDTAEATINDPVTGLTATASGLLSVTSIVTTQGGEIDELTGDVSTLADEVVALATAIIAVETDFDGRFAGGLFKITAVSAPSGWSARVALQARASTGNGFVSAGIYIDAKSTGETRVVIDAENTVFTGRIRSVNGLSYWDLNTGEFRSEIS
ncbi:MAG: hypothetical protein KIT02_10275 [Devosia sp.]|uniref:hypothetical protein n=1 Tax=Devosia sp. TaxID=1871048 RepID=UPI0024CC24D5|nr:hypothetical protein [Devosia sp.]UYN98352.1 MAG: hypothetical protein KIT02_10275 [Devosia sp.]